MIRFPMKSLAALVVAMLLMPIPVWAISPEALSDLLASDDRPTVIDIRDADTFQSGHLPGAINISWRVIDRKMLPPLGRVVVYGDGLDEAPVDAAVDALNRKTGITAEKLDGGVLAWEAINQPTTHSNGLRENTIPYVTYQQLETMVGSNPAVVLVDLRQPSSGSRSALSGKTASSATPLTDLSRAFPGARVAGSPFASGNRTAMAQSSGAGEDSLYILIDNGDGAAEKMARRLVGSGKKRVAILAGGEAILVRNGKSGLIKK